MANHIISQWRAGETPDARAALSQCPDLTLFRSVALDLIYEEYCLRQESGDSVDASAFCRRYTEFARTVAQQIEVHQLLEGDDDWLQEQLAPSWPELDSEWLGFDIEDELGRGGFSRVYLARERDLGDRYVTIKVCRDARREAQILGRLEHPNIVPIHSVKQTDDGASAAICTPYRARASLQDVLHWIDTDPTRRDPRALLQLIAADNSVGRATRPSRVWRKGTYEDAMVEVFAELAQAIGYAHERGVIHFDLKPSNVLLTPDGRPMLVDFNLSVEHTDDAWIGGGTVPYMSPEQLRRFLGDEETVPDHRSDVYSLGVMMFELFSGQHPHGPLSVQPAAVAANKLKWRQDNSTIDWPSQWHDRISDRLRAMISRCLAQDPDDRPSMSTIVDELRRHLSVLGRVLVRRSQLVAVLILLVGAITLGLVFLRPSRARKLERLKEMIESGQAKQAVARLDRLIIANPDDLQARLLRVDGRFAIGERDLAIADMKYVAESTGSLEHLWRTAHLLSVCQRYSESNSWCRKGVLRTTWVAHHICGFNYRRLANYSMAIASCSRALAAQKDLVPTLHNRALAYESRNRQGDLRKAADDVAKAVELDARSLHLVCSAARILSKAAKKYPRYGDAARRMTALARKRGATTDPSAPTRSPSIATPPAIEEFLLSAPR